MSDTPDLTAPIANLSITPTDAPDTSDASMPHTIELPLTWTMGLCTCHFRTDLRRWTLNGRPIFRVPRDGEEAFVHTKAGAAPLLSLFDPAVVEALRAEASD